VTFGVLALLPMNKLGVPSRRCSCSIVLWFLEINEERVVRMNEAKKCGERPEPRSAYIIVTHGDRVTVLRLTHRRVFPGVAVLAASKLTQPVGALLSQSKF